MSPRGGEEVSRVAHNHEIVGSIPTPATNFAGVAQRLEQILHKDKAAGSNPAAGT